MMDLEHRRTDLDNLITACRNTQLEAAMAIELLRYMLRNEFHMEEAHIELLFEMCRNTAKTKLATIAADFVKP